MFVASTAAPTVTSVTDVASDQGGRVRLLFARSPFDHLGSGTPITGYKILRRQVVAGLLATAGSVTDRRGADPASTQLLGWDELAMITATGDDFYQVVVPTLADSNGAGFHHAVFLARALTATPTTYYDSAPDSGYSVDNLPPVPPAPFTAEYAAGATQLHWGDNTEPDLWHYKLYRGSSAAFTPSADNLIANVSATDYADVGPAGSYYKLSAVDVNGNESACALVTPGGTLDVGSGTIAFALDRVPNPSRDGRLAVTFSLPSGARATLEAMDVSGRRAAVCEVGSLGAGRHTIQLADRRLAAGIYFVRLTQGERFAIMRATVLE